jgi:hypothetical protein
VDTDRLVGLVCILSVVIFTTLIQQWVRSYIKVFDTLAATTSDASLVSTKTNLGRQASTGDGYGSPFVDPFLARPILYRPVRLYAQS